MTPEDLQKLDIHSLRDLLTRVEIRLAKFDDEELADAIDTIREIADRRGLTFEQLVREAAGTKRRRPKKPNGAPKFKHPQRDDVTWTGRGRVPKWITQLEAEGGSREDCRIVPDNA